MRQICRLFIFLLLFSVLFSARLYANEPAHGFCEEGNRTVAISGLISTTKVQQSFPACTITVYLHSVSPPALATLYSDNAATPTPLANPFTANADGSWRFYAANGGYDVVLSGAGFPAPFTISDIQLSSASFITNFGAKCDGTTNDTPALVTANNAMVSAGGGTIVIPSAVTCLLGTSVTTSVGVTIQGMTKGILSIASAATATLNEFYGDVSQHFISGSAMSGGSLVLGPNVTEIYPQWWGASGIGDGSDQWAAFRSAIDSMQTFPGQAATDHSRGTTLTVPHGKYQLNTELRIDRTMTLKCAGGGWSTREGCQLDFPANSASQSGGNTGNGILVIRHAGGTGGDGTGTAANPESYALNVTIEGVFVNSLATTGGTGVGIGITGTTTLRDVTVQNFPSHGIYIQSAIGAGTPAWADSAGSELITPIAPSQLGGAGNKGGPDSWFIENTLSQINHGDGLHIVGGDSNGGTSINFQSNSNTLCGMSDQSGIGSTHIQYLAAGNSLCTIRTMSAAGIYTIIGSNLTEGNGTEQNVYSDGTLLLNSIVPTTILAGTHAPKFFRASGTTVSIPTLLSVNASGGASGATSITSNIGGANGSIADVLNMASTNEVNSITSLIWDETSKCWFWRNANSSTLLPLEICSHLASGVLADSIVAPNGITVGSGAGTSRIYAGLGSPVNAVTAPVGSLFMRQDGGTDTTLYSKITGTGNTGWEAMQQAALKAVATLNFTSINPGQNLDQTITVTGARVPDGVIVSKPDTGAPIPAGALITAWVSANDTVTVRLQNVNASGGAAINIGMGNTYVQVFSYN